MLNAILTGLAVAVPLLVAFVYGYGQLSQAVKAMPGALRTEMKLEIKREMERHIEKYRHEQVEVTGVRAMGHPEDATG